MAQQPHKTIHNLDIDIPTVDSLFNLTNELAPEGSKLPNLVRDYVNDIYRANYGTKNPIETFSELSGIDDLSSLLVDTNLSVLNESVVYDASAYNPPDITNPQFSAYKSVCEVIGYYLSTTGKIINKPYIDSSKSSLTPKLMTLIPQPSERHFTRKL